MKRIMIALFMVMTLVIAAVVYAGTSGGNTPAIGTFAVPLTVPKVAGAVCTTIGAGRTTEGTINVAATKMISWKAFSTTDGAAVVVKRRLASASTAYMPSSGETNLPVEAAASTFVFQRYTGNATITLCADKN